MTTDIRAASARRRRPNGLIGEYYSKLWFRERHAKRIERTLEFCDALVLGHISKDGYSIRWSGSICAPRADTYRFYLTFGQGVRVWMDDKLVVERQDGMGTVTIPTESFALHAGQEVSLRIDSWSPGNKVTALLEWETPSLERRIVPMERLYPFPVWQGGELPPVEPLFEYDIRDCQIMLGPDGMYYMTGTNGPDHWNHNDGIHIWKSPDMTEWTDLGLIWSLDRDATWANRRDPEGRRPLWAPELHFIRGTYWLTYSMGWWDGMKSGLLESITGRAEGPYKEAAAGPLVDSIDASLFEDDDGRVYFIYANCLIARMNDDLDGFAEPFRQLVDGDGRQIGFEGASMFKHNGKYYVVAARTNFDYNLSAAYPQGLQSYDAVAASADHIYGPYGAPNLALRHGGHGALFRDRQGDVWMSFFISGDNDNVPFMQRPAAVRMRFREDGKLIPLAAPEEIIPVSLERGRSWRYTFCTPLEGWTLREFDDDGWQAGTGGFGSGTAGPPGSIVRTIWDSPASELWLRQAFRTDGLTAARRDELYLSVYSSGPAEIYLNGMLAATLTEGTNHYRSVPIRREAKKAMAAAEAGLHVMALHTSRSAPPVFVDAGITLWAES